MDMKINKAGRKIIPVEIDNFVAARLRLLASPP
jgi:hypothetical protein